MDKFVKFTKMNCREVLRSINKHGLNDEVQRGSEGAELTSNGVEESSIRLNIGPKREQTVNKKKKVINEVNIEKKKKEIVESEG